MNNLCIKIVLCSLIAYLHLFFDLFFFIEIKSKIPDLIYRICIIYIMFDKSHKNNTNDII